MRSLKDFVRRFVVKRLTLALCLVASGLGALRAQSSTAATATPSAGRTVSLPLGSVDAITGTLAFNVPIGPKLPGRIPIGFTWSYQSASLMFQPASQSGVYRPVVWPAPGDPNANLHTTVLINGEPWVFYPQVTNPAMPTSASWWLAAMNARGVALQQPVYGPSGYVVDGPGTFYATTAPSSDGTKFLVSFGYTTPVSHYDPNSGTTTYSTMNLGTGFAVLDGPNAIWIQDLWRPMGYQVGQTQDVVTHFTNSWGDHVTSTETFTQLSSDCWAPEKIVLSDTHTAAAITLQLQASGTQVGQANGVTGSVQSDQATITVTSNINGVVSPTVTLTGTWYAILRYSIPPSIVCSNYDPNATRTPLGISDWWFVPNSIQAAASDGTSRTTTFTWPTMLMATGLLLPDGNPSIVTLPGGLTETFGGGGGINYSQYSFSPCNGVYTGFSVTASQTTPAAVVKVPSNNPDAIDATSGGVTHITLKDPADPTAGQTILIARLQPQWTGVGDQQWTTWTMDQPQHMTTILRYATASPGANEPFRGVRLTHMSFSDMLSDYQGLRGYLFATSAVLQEEAIYGNGIPSNLDYPNDWQPSGTTTYRTTVYDGFDLHSWANPTGALLNTSLPVTAIARRTSVFSNLPTKVTLAGDPSDSGAYDAYGPIRTDEWTGPTQAATSVATVLSNSLASSQVNFSNSVTQNSVSRRGQISRHFDWNLLRLLVDSDAKTLGGSALNQYRFAQATPGAAPVAGAGISSASFGTTAYAYDSAGRIATQTGTRGAFTATETRTYNSTLPQIADTTKALTQGTATYYANPANTNVVVGTHTTFDSTYYQWPATDTDKVDGRPVTYNTRDGMGRVTKQTSELGIVTDTAYNAWGQVSLVTREAAGGVGSVTTTTTYDPNGRWKKETVTTSDTGLSLTTETDYDAYGHVVKTILPDGSTQTSTYDGFGELVSQTPMLKPGQKNWGSATWAYDPQGRITDEYDAQGRHLLHVVQQPAWGTAGGATGVVSIRQNDWDLIQSSQTQRSEVVDILGQKAAIVDQAGQVSRYWYDQDGHLIETQQGSQFRMYAYNDMGWLMSRTEPEEGTTSYSNFTLLGTPLTTIQTGRSGSRNDTFSTALNAHLQPITVTASGPEGTVTRNLTYDDSATHHLLSVTETQAITGLASQTVSETYDAYDGLDRLTTKSIYDGTTASYNQKFTVARNLDALGNTKTLTYPTGGGEAGPVVTTAYDNLNRPSSVKLNGALRGMMTYDQISGTAVTNTLYLGNDAQTISKVDKGELTLSEHLAASGVIENNPMTWTAGGLMLTRGSDTFTYDSLQRLSHSKVTGVYSETEEQWYAYDPNGNRIQNNFIYTAATGSTQPAETLAWSYAATGANDLPASLTALAPGAPGTASTGSLSTGALYDDLGRLTQVWTTPGQASTQTTWIYDPSGRVMKENGTTYLLDASGLRFKRTKSDGTVDYTVYGFGREPLAQFEIPATQTKTASTTTSSKTMMMTSSGSLPPDPAGAYILQPSGPITVAPGQVINFQGSTDYGTSFTWTFGDGATATGLTASHAFSAVGTYTVVFKASATGYGTTQASVTVTVMAKPSITSFTATPSSITAGQSSTLAWTTSGATSLSINQGVGAVTGTSASVSPTSTTTYTLTATNAAGSVTATVTVAVSAPAPPTITSFTASPTKITSGQSSTLSWSISGAASVSISGIGTVTGSSVAVTPGTTTSYTLTATNAAGSNTATITVTVETQLPVITDFWSNPVQIASGQTATLSWFVSQADSLSLDNGIGTVTGSTWSVGPTATTTYTLTATNLIGSVTATVTVSVGAPGTLVWKKTMVYGFGQELAEDQPGMGTTFIQSDFVGSPSITTNASGAVIGRSKALPFGERQGQWGQKTVRRYTNHEDDADSNAIYMQAREYLPAYGKFAQVDPAYDQTKDDPESWNLYNYVTNNPVTHTDPDGRMPPTPLTSAQRAMLEDTGSAIGGDGSLWTVQSAGGNTLSGEVTKSTQPSASDTTSTSAGAVDANASANGGSGTGAGQQAAAPDPATPAQTTPSSPGGPNLGGPSSIDPSAPLGSAKNPIDLGSATVEVVDTAPKTEAGKRQAMLSDMREAQGTPYGHDQKKQSPGLVFDCSGFVKWAYRLEGYVFKLGRGSSGATQIVGSAGVSRTSNPVPGDLIYWNVPDPHIMIYTGDGMAYGASSPRYKPGIDERPIRYYGKPEGFYHVEGFDD